MKTNILFSTGKKLGAGIAFFLLICAIAIFSSSSTQAAGEDLMVQNISCTPYNGAAVLTWDMVFDAANNPASDYEVSWDIYSLQDGFIDDYSNHVNIGSQDPSYTLADLTNGVRIYAAIKAIAASGKTSAEYSEECVVIPSSVYSAVPNTAGSVQNTATENGAVFMVESAEALTTNMVEVQFSQNVLLPSVLQELAFSVVNSQDPSETLNVEVAEYKTDYADTENEVVHQDIVWLTLTENTAVDTEYTVTVSSVVTAENGDVLDNGVTDNFEFSGTDRTEIAPEKAALTEESLKAAAPEETSSPEEDISLAENVVLEPVAEEEGGVITSAAEADTIAPENVTNFQITSTAREKDFLVNMSWKKSTSEDVANQTLYKSENKGSSWNNGISLGKDTEKQSDTGAPETELTYKVSATDIAGNENSGTISSIRLPSLASSGAPFALIALGTSLLGASIRRKKHVL